MKEDKELENINPELVEDYKLWRTMEDPLSQGVYSFMLGLYVKSRDIWLTVIYFILFVLATVAFPVWGLLFDIWRWFAIRRLRGQQK